VRARSRHRRLAEFDTSKTENDRGVPSPTKGSQLTGEIGIKTLEVSLLSEQRMFTIDQIEANQSNE